MYFYEHYHYGNESAYNALELVNPTCPAHFHRIRNACKLLRETNVPIAEIAFRCGYDSIQTFNRNFIAVEGTTPRYYR